MAGKRFGKLVVREMIYNALIEEKSKYRRTYCVCACDCGNEIIVDASRLKSGKKQSCGCDSSLRKSLAYRYNLEGKRFGRLSVIESLYGSKTRCICDCGNIVVVSTTDLISGHTQSCGCLQKERVSFTSVRDFSGTVSDFGVKLLKQAEKNDKNQWLWECECGLCGKHFIALPAKVLNGHITSCGCRRKSSKEQMIETILKDNHIQYETQYSLPDCKNKQTLFFDFAIFKENKLQALIEYDGQQHFYPVEIFGGEDNFAKTKLRDEIKNRFCQEEGICLHRLPYTMTDQEIKEKVMNIIYP